MLYLLCCPGTHHRGCLAFYVRFLCVLRIPVGFAEHPGRICGTRPFTQLAQRREGSPDGLSNEGQLPQHLPTPPRYFLANTPPR
jgi:hypothetical protein